MADLFTLVPSIFKPLYDAEIALLRNVTNGNLTWRGNGVEQSDFWDQRNDPEQAESWAPNRQIRAELLRWLCADLEAEKLIHPSGIAIGVARILGRLDLSHLILRFPLRLNRCCVSDGIDLYYAEAHSLNFLSSRIGPIGARRLVVKGNFLLGGKSTIQGELNLRDARILGDLDCSGGSFRNPGDVAIMGAAARVGHSLRLGISSRADHTTDLFHAEGKVDFTDAEIGGDFDCAGGHFSNSTREALKVEGARIAGSVFMRRGFNANGEVNLVSAHIGSDLHCEGGTFRNPGTDRIAIKANGIRVDGRVFFLTPFNAKGEVSLPGAEINGELNCTGGRFLNPGSEALVAQGAKIGNAVYLNSGFRAEGMVDLTGAEIGGALVCTDGNFHNQSGVSLSLRAARIQGQVFLNDNFDANGEVNLIDAHLAGTLECADGRFFCEGGSALMANGLRVDGNVFLNPGFLALGEVNLVGARIGHYLECAGGQFLNPGRLAIAADGASIGGGVIFSIDDRQRVFRAEGAVHLTSAEIGGTLHCLGAQIFNLGGTGLTVHATKIQGDVVLAQAVYTSPDGDQISEFNTSGLVILHLAEIAGSLSLNGARFSGQNENGLLAQNLTVKGTLRWSKVVCGARTKVDLSRATVGMLQDDDTWPANRRLNLDGFAYGSISNTPLDLRQRLVWLSSQEEGFKPQPYRQLAKVFSETGRESDAKRILIERENQRRHYLLRSLGQDGQSFWRGALTFIRWCFGSLLRWTIGYGYQPLRALIGVALFVIFGFVVFGSAYMFGFVTPTDKDAYASFVSNGNEPPVYYQPFNAFVYSVETFIPLLQLHQEREWLPNPQRGQPLCRFRLLCHEFYIRPGNLIRWYLWVHILAGWFFATMLIAGVTGLVRKD